jgi:hypothetical protein
MKKGAKSMASVALHLRLTNSRKGGKIMMPFSYFLGLAMAGVLLGNPAKGLTDDTFPAFMKPDNNAVERGTPEYPPEELAQHENRTEPFQIAAVDYCYAGSTADPTTGETFDLYTLCSYDAIEQNLDLG